MLKILKIIFLLVFCLTPVIHAEDEPQMERVFRGLGREIIQNEDSAKASELAHRSALIDAVEKLYQQRLGDDDQSMSRFVMNREKFLKGPFPFVIETETLNVKKTQGLIRTEVEVEFDLERFELYLYREGILKLQQLQNQDISSVLLLVLEINSQSVNIEPYCAGKIEQELKSQNIHFVNTKVVKRSMDQFVRFRTDLVKYPDIVRGLAVEHGVDIILVGTCFSRRLQNNYRYREVELDFDVFDGKYYKKLFQIKKNADSDNLDHEKVLDDAYSQAVSQMIPEVLDRARSMIQQEDEHQKLVIRGMSFANWAWYRKHTERGTPGVVDLELAGFEGDVLTYELRVVNSLTEFSNFLEEKNFERFSLKKVSENPREIIFEVFPTGDL